MHSNLNLEGLYAFEFYLPIVMIIKGKGHTTLSHIRMSFFMSSQITTLCKSFIAAY
jgi:hypothetical protein